MRASSNAVCLSSSSTPAWVGAVGGLEYSAGAVAPSAALLSACNVQARS